MNATEPSVKCYSGIPLGILLLQRSRGRSRNTGMGTVWYCFASCSG